MSKLKTCEKCQRRFSCDAENKCWCFEIKLNPKEREEIQRQFDNCLCRYCLNSYSSQDKK